MTGSLLAQSPEAVNDRAQQLAQGGRADEAAVLWRQLPGSFFPAAFNLGYFHYSRKEFAEAAGHLQRAAKLQPADFNSWFLLGQARSALGQRDEALRAWRVALGLRPDHAKLMGIMAVEYSQGGYYREAAAVAKRAHALRPQDAEAHLLAVKMCQEAQDADGPALAERAVQQHAADARAHFEWAWFLQRAGRSAESAAALRRAMELDPAYEEPHFFYGGILLDEGKLEEALAPLRKAVELRPDYTGAAVALGRALMELERWDEAAAVLTQAAERDPRHPQPVLMLARLYYRQGDEAKARAAKERSLRLRREGATLLEKPQGREFK